ncbi:hypothetical protein IV454_00615 [Massilia antarctica]|uniref:Uncharacterized protein n=1 Tax=Massilia antarctica TaxID=2765360 RepID=A0AA49A8B2_9BURK|nr:hypothetical protein [Massilia antarctica]QPI50179.1 hypothetical protein IV454_00615 [Massilia antarctica]
MDDSDDPPDQTVSRVDFLANIALATGFLLPLWAAMSGSGDAYAAGRFIGGSLVAVFLILALLKGILKTHLPLRMACAKLAVALILILISLGKIGAMKRDMGAIRAAGQQLVATMNETGEAAGPAAPVAASEEARQVVAFVNGAGALLKRQVAERELLDKEFEKLDMSTLLTPEALTSRTGIAASRAKMARYGELLIQRDQMIIASVEEGRVYVRTANVPEHYRGSELGAGAQVGAETLKLNAQLTAVGKEFIKAVGKVLDFAQSQLGKASFQNGKLMFASERDVATFRALSREMEGIGVREAAVVERFNTHVEKTKKDAARDLAPAKR